MGGPQRGSNHPNGPSRTAVGSVFPGGKLGIFGGKLPLFWWKTWWKTLKTENFSQTFLKLLVLFHEKFGESLEKVRGKFKMRSWETLVTSGFFLYREASRGSFIH